MVSQPSRGKLFCLIESNLLPVDDEDFYSDEDDQDTSGMDGSDDMLILATEDMVYAQIFSLGESTARNEEVVTLVHGEEILPE
jgi:hypothetical protein